MPLPWPVSFPPSLGSKSRTNQDGCLQAAEDINFNFVYALHTFVATVQGQANATKGDTMALLDDTNSYWWLVRVIKDSSIGTSHSLYVRNQRHLTSTL